jgi:hypothetical protein
MCLKQQAGADVLTNHTGMHDYILLTDPDFGGESLDDLTQHQAFILGTRVRD